VKSDYLKFIVHCLWIGLVALFGYFVFDWMKTDFPIYATAGIYRYEYHSMDFRNAVTIFDKKTGILNMLQMGDHWYHSRWDPNASFEAQMVWESKKNK